MAYQNNNNRLVPKATEDRTLKPAATVTDKMIKYNPTNAVVGGEKATQLSNMANALASIGKGMMDIDTSWKYTAQENAIKARWIEETKEGGWSNKKQWNEVSKNIKGLAILNPYNDDAYRSLQAEDIGRAAALELYTTPDLDKMDKEAFNGLVKDKTEKMIKAFKETGLSPKDYGHTLTRWDTTMQNVQAEYLVGNAKYKFEQLQIKETSDTTFQIEAALSECENGTESATLRTVLENKIAHLGTDTGIVASDTQAKVVIGGIKNYIARNAGQIDDAELLASVKDLKLSDGKNLSEVVPNYDIMVKDLLTQARQAQLSQMKLEVEVDDFKQQQKIKEVITDFMKKYTNGEIKSPDEIQAYAKKMIGEYGLDGMNSMQMFIDLAKGRKTWTDLADVESDPKVLANLGMKVLTGDADYSDISTAIGNGTLNVNDGLRLANSLQTKEQKQQTAESKKVTEHIKASKKEFLEGYHTGDSDIDAVLLDPDQQTAFQNKLLQLHNEYEQDHDYQKFNNNLAKYKSAYKQYANERDHNTRVTGMKQGYEALRKTPAISKEQWNKVDINKSTQALRKMGLVLNDNLMKTKDDTITIASKPQEHRKITVTENGKTYTKNTRHTGYDLAGKNVYMGRPVYSPMKGTVVGVLPAAQSGGMGNMVLVQCENGKFIKYMHLQNAGLPRLGQVVDNKTAIGHIGNTGAVQNKQAGSLHVEFYDKNQQWITAHQFLNK